MPSERIQRRIDALLDEAEQALAENDWATLGLRCRAVLALDPDNGDAAAYLAAAERAGGAAPSADGKGGAAAAGEALPASFVGGRYRVLRLLGRGGRKRVYLARDERLGREVAFAVIPTSGLAPAERERALREAQAMARLGSSPFLVAIHDIGEDGGDLFTVQEFMAGGDVARLIAERPPVGHTLAVAKDVCRALAAVHEAGIVHRDLKPANVFLTADGSARVGDLGLAATAGLDRITQHGTMVGTVAYMPPEQALGGDVGPASDLYSLGSMLYEMITGRPPFTGDDPTAVISQHINTPPVAPSWHTEDCPPALEALILHLLEKDPAKRPSSAKDVLAAIEPIDPAQKSTRHSDENPLARLARGVFVGREKELERLRTAFDEAFAGRGGLVMLVGEPGIGKTRTTQELETYARMRGATVLWGRSHEGSGAPPYWPWVQVGRQWAGQHQLATIAQEMAQTQGELVRLYPELRTNNPNFVEPQPITDPESAQFRLFDAYATFVRAMQGQGPMLVALDDLHWADKPTLLLLQHIARDLSRLRVLVVCTYRDTDLSRTHPLSEALAALNRDPGFQRIVLRGLNREEVASYIRETANVSPKAEVIDHIFEETEGNPFFLTEVVNLLTQEGTLLKESVSEIAVPDGVREALGRRLDRLSEEANELLQVAAIAGREFAYDTLTLLGDRPEDDLLKLIEEGLEARVIEEMAQPGRYRFTHALMQETLLDELSTTRRVRLHGQVGEALEQRWGERSEDYASRLAAHFMESSTLTPRHAQRAVRYGKIAAYQANGNSAWDEAARWFERALTLVSAAEDGLGEDEAELLATLGDAHRLNADFGPSFRAYRRAIDLFRARSDGVGFARVANSMVDTNLLRPEREVELVDEALAELGDRDPRLRASLLAWQAGASGVAIEAARVGEEQARDRRLQSIAEMQALSAGHDWPEVKARAAFRMSEWFGHEGDRVRSSAAAEQASADFARAGMFQQASFAAMVAAGFDAAAGELDRATARMEQAFEFSHKHHVPYQMSNIAVILASIALARCDAAALAEYATACHHRWADLVVAKSLADQGRFADALALFPDPRYWPARVRVQARAETTRILAASGRVAQARAEFEAWHTEYEAGRETLGILASESLVQLDGALLELASRAHIADVYERLTSRLDMRFNQHGGHAVDRFRGDIAFHLGKVEEAEQWYRTCLEWTTRERCPVELGRCHQGLAEIAALRDDLDGALDHLDKAAALFRQHGTKLFLDQVIRRKLELQGAADSGSQTSIFTVSRAVQGERPNLSLHAGPDGTVALLFSDIEGSTALNERLGDARWLEVLRAHNAIVDRAVVEHAGRTVKTMGDGYMVVFASPEAAVRCALAMQMAVTAVPLGTRDSELGTSIRVRIGIHLGRAMREGGDFFGREVNFAARVAASALGGEVVVSGAVRERLPASFVCEAPRAVEFKGFDGSHEVSVVRMAGT